MKKALLSIGILCALGITACGGSDSRKDDPIFTEPDNSEAEKPFVRVVFNPATSDLNVPNDLLMLPAAGNSFFDFTLNTEGTDTFDAGNPSHTLSALDGWSVHQPMVIRVETPEGMDIDPATVNGDSIKLFEATQALLGTSTECQAIAAEFQTPGVPCELGRQLVYGVDYVTSYTAGTDTINLIPLKVLNAGQGHLLVVTESLKDLTGRPVKGSGTWDLMRQNINTNQVGVEALIPLQKIVNYMVDVLDTVDVEREELSYAAYFSTQSTGDVLSSIKKLNIAPFASVFQQVLSSSGDAVAAQQAARAYLPSIVTQASESTNAFELMAPVLLTETQLADLASVGLNSCASLLATLAEPESPLFQIAVDTFAVAGPFCATSIVSGKVNLPYYLEPDAPTTGWWQAACTSGATLRLLGQETIGGLLQAGQVGPNNDLCQLASDNQLFDLDLTSLGLSDPRNLTQFNPLPLAKGRQTDDPDTGYNEAGTESIDVFITVPNESVIATVSAATGGAVIAQQKPESGWPVVLFSHGITGNRKDVLALSATLSLAGFASVAIDHPLHGDRGMIGPDGTLTKISLTSISDFLNFASLLTARDNSRQSSADIMGLRLSLNSIVDETQLVDLDTSKVHFVAHSLGSITGSVAIATANSSLEGEMAPFDDMYSFTSAVLNVPAGGIPSFILESPDFGPLIKGSLLAETSETFAAFVEQYASTNGVEKEFAIRPAFTQFMASLTPEQLAPIEAGFAQFNFAAQTVLDSADPISYAATLGETTAVLTQLSVGGGVNDDGSTALSDQVNPVVTSLPLIGGQPLADLIGLEKLSSSADKGGVVRFITGDHFSLFTPTASAAATSEMHSQMVSFFTLQGQGVVITDASVIEN
ncbi:VolA/Pla-1 family phospholipase [Paraglaciecola sp. L3A3]|uniref:VolA/Pla-1 family phospholipase n=1 Tax=Paraglaciecola sp. L3A3 TaxID=2686358 RepID=UPI00131CA1A1|nr:VolA/Pla-1 family phospholipase [Paraglaciecola sp. L3A3]